MNIKRIDRVRIVTTPDALQEIARRLQVAWENTRLGEITPSVIEYGVGANLEVEFYLDQDEMHRQEVPRKVRP